MGSFRVSLGLTALMKSRSEFRPVQIGEMSDMGNPQRGAKDIEELARKMDGEVLQYMLLELLIGRLKSCKV